MDAEEKSEKADEDRLPENVDVVTLVRAEEAVVFRECEGM